MRVWITKYALTTGIIEAEAEECEHDMIRAHENSFCPSYYHKEGRDWHRTKESAIAKAEEMRQKKISSLKKQIKKMEDMKFE